MEQSNDIELLQLVKKILLTQKDNDLDHAIIKGLRSPSGNKVMVHEDVMSFFIA